MKIIDKNGRLFGKISVIDVLVILVVAVMAFALYVKNNSLSVTSTSGSVSVPKSTFGGLCEIKTTSGDIRITVEE